MTKYNFIKLTAHNAKDISGGAFGRLTAIGPIERTSGRKIKWLCICKCGTECAVDGAYLRSAHSKSCGCLKTEGIIRRTTTHGIHGHSIYGTWKNMRDRCNNQNSPSWDNYGGRGIKVCAAWDDFAVFLSDMGVKPSPQHSIDRINNSLGYFPENCRWATREQQNSNSRNNRMITLQGRTLTLAQWSRRTGINRATIASRIKKGLSVEHTLTRPVRSPQCN